jgi:hypothetical protein
MNWKISFYNRTEANDVCTHWVLNLQFPLMTLDFPAEILLGLLHNLLREAFPSCQAVLAPYPGVLRNFTGTLTLKYLRCSNVPSLLLYVLVCQHKYHKQIFKSLDILNSRIKMKKLVVYIHIYIKLKIQLKY